MTTFEDSEFQSEVSSEAASAFASALEKNRRLRYLTLPSTLKYLVSSLAVSLQVSVS